MIFKTKTATMPLLATNIVFFVFQLIFTGFTEALMLSTADIITRPWILITSMFLHSGFGHLFFNMYALLIFGPLLESRIGKKRFFFMYFLSGLVASIGYSLFMPNSFALGASGAIMGMLGVTIMLLPHLPVLFFFILPMSLRTAGIIFALIDIFGLFNPASGIGHWAHLFGLATGLLYGWYLLKKRDKFKTAFNTLKKFSQTVEVKPEHKKKVKPEVRDADFSYSESIQLSDEDIQNYLKNGRL